MGRVVIGKEGGPRIKKKADRAEAGRFEDPSRRGKNEKNAETQAQGGTVTLGVWCAVLEKAKTLGETKVDASISTEGRTRREAPRAIAKTRRYPRKSRRKTRKRKMLATGSAEKRRK